MPLDASSTSSRVSRVSVVVSGVTLTVSVTPTAKRRLECLGQFVSIPVTPDEDLAELRLLLNGCALAADVERIGLLGRRVQVLPEVHAGRGLPRPGPERRLAHVEAAVVDLAVVPPLHAHDAGLAECVVERQVEDSAQSALGVVRQAIPQLDRLDLAYRHMQVNRLLGVAVRAGDTCGLGRRGRDRRFNVFMSDLGDRERARAVQVPPRAREPGQIEGLRWHQFHLPANEPFTGLSIPLDRDAGDDALASFGDREGDVHPGVVAIDHQGILRAHVVVTLAPVQLADALEPEFRRCRHERGAWRDGHRGENLVRGVYRIPGDADLPDREALPFPNREGDACEIPLEVVARRVDFGRQESLVTVEALQQLRDRLRIGEDLRFQVPFVDDRLEPARVDLRGPLERDDHLLELRPGLYPEHRMPPGTAVLDGEVHDRLQVLVEQQPFPQDTNAVVAALGIEHAAVPCRAHLALDLRRGCRALERQLDERTTRYSECQAHRVAVDRRAPGVLVIADTPPPGTWLRCGRDRFVRQRSRTGRRPPA